MINRFFSFNNILKFFICCLIKHNFRINYTIELKYPQNNQENTHKIIRKMTNIQRNFEKALTLYQSKASVLPPKISWKLDLILYIVRGNVPNKELLSIEQLMDYGDLQNLEPQSLKAIFNNIIDTLFNKDTVQTKKCLLKKKGLFTNWLQATIQYNKTHFLLNYSNKTQSFEKQDVALRIRTQNKKIFDLDFKGTNKCSLKFQNQSEMKSIWRNWQKEIIDTKTQKNYEEMKNLINMSEHQTLMDRISLFDLTYQKNPSQSDKKNCSPKALTSTIYQNSFCIDKELTTKITNKIKNATKQIIQLKPAPHNFVCKLKGQQSIIAINKDDEARVYVQHIFSGKIQQKRLLSFLFLQKSWNSYIIMEIIQKTDVPNQIKILRKYDTLKDIGEFVQIQVKATYLSLNSNMSMITFDTQLNRGPGNKDLIDCNSVITLQSDNSKVRILIEEQLSSKKHSNLKLKKMLLEMYREIIKLELIHENVIFKDFDAQTIIVNMLEDELSTNTTESQQSIGYFEGTSNQESIGNDQKKGYEETVQMIPKMKSVKNCDQELIRLKSPYEIPNGEYITMIRNRQYEKNYFKMRFNQQILTKYEDYIPHYRIDKLIENKIYEITESRQLRFIDAELIQSQKDIFMFVLKQIGGNLLTGKSILNVSLPVAVFEPRSALERYAAELGCAPDYLIPRAQSSSLQQIKYITGMLMNIVCCELLMRKPFNAILGQTFQCYIKGIPVYYEQISHHPPISAYYMTCPEFTIYGKFIPFIDISFNTGVGGNLGAVNIIFKNGSHFQCYFPPSQISGFLYGDRKFRCYNRGYVFEKKTRLYSQFSIQNTKKGVYQSPVKLKGGQIIGGIFKVKQQFIDEIEKYRGQHKNLKKFGGLSKQMIEEKYHSVSGEWFGKIKIDQKVINEKMLVYPVQYAKNVLPSDSNHRLDLLYLRMKDMSRSQKEKQVLQVLQRNDRKLRQKYASKR